MGVPCRPHPVSDMHVYVQQFIVAWNRRYGVARHRVRYRTAAGTLEQRLLDLFQRER